MQALPQPSQPAASRAFTIILERLYAMARHRDVPLGAPSDLEATLIALPCDKRTQVMLVLESVESRATARADQELAEAARAVQNAAERVWTSQGTTDHRHFRAGDVEQKARAHPEHN
jgi:hypothetical protein